MSDDVDLGTLEASTENVSMGEALSATLDAAYDAVNGPERDETGKFKGGDTHEQNPPEEGEQETAEQEAPEVEAAPQPIQPPQSMSAADREAFTKLPPESQKWLTEREKQMTADYTKKSMETADKGKRFDRLEQIIAPRRQQLAMQGLDESTAIGQLFALSDFADKDPVGFSAYLLKQRGIDPAQAFSQSTGQPVDPVIAATQRELAGVKQYIQSLQQQQVAQTQSVATSAVEAFAGEKDKDGNALRPHYAELEPEMIPIVQQLREAQPGKSPAEYLQMAYDRAVWANPKTRGLMQAETEAKRTAEALRQAKEAAAKAKKTASSNVTSTGISTGGKAKAGTMLDTLSEAWDRSQGVA